MSAAAILKLQASGFSSEQVSALAELVDTQAATKTDLEASSHSLELKIGSLKTDIDAVEHRLELKITDVKGDVNILKWMMGFVLAFQVAIFVKMFLPATIH